MSPWVRSSKPSGTKVSCYNGRVSAIGWKRKSPFPIMLGDYYGYVRKHFQKHCVQFGRAVMKVICKSRRRAVEESTEKFPFIPPDSHTWKSVKCLCQCDLESAFPFFPLNEKQFTRETDDCSDTQHERFCKKYPEWGHGVGGMGISGMTGLC